ncbi:MAG: peptidoglycan DD-metalloendopeptidase family protein [Oscillospiraceae bacterium]|nr:peptidoglycan DD-metalloendopeptidase family protein [Oscillospiraceae bacterium]
MSKLVLVSASKSKEDSKITVSKRKRTAVLTVLLIIAFIMTGTLVSQTGYAVSIDGEVVGTVKSGEEVDEIIRKVENDVSDILGYDYEITTAVELTGTVGGDDSEIADAFMNTVEEIDMMYILRIDGEYAACAWTEEVITAAVEEVTERYKMGEDSTVSFDNEVAVTYDYAPIADAVETDELADILDPAKGGEFALRIRTVVHETYEKPVAFEYDLIENDELYEGTTAVLVEGVDGTADVTDKVEYINGTEVSRVEVHRIITQQPVTQVVSVGTLFRPAWVSYGEYIWPAEGVITSYYGPRNIFYGYSFHEGIDIASDLNTPIVAADGGEVIFAGRYYGYGLMIDIRHDNGEVTRYGHCNELLVEEGQKVARGELIAYMGTTGVSSGVHLHFEIQVDGEPIDPMTRLPE